MRSKSLRLAVFCAALAVPMSVVVPAGAVTPSSGSAKTKPTADITTSGYSPTSLNIMWSGPPPDKKCTAALVAIHLTNKTSKTQDLTYKGKFYFGVLAGKTAPLCAWGKGNKTIVFGLKHSTSTLTLHLS
jgi:hypothetical protein